MKKFTKLQAKCFKEGVDAFLADACYLDCPYKDRTVRHDYWNIAYWFCSYGWDYYEGEIDLCVGTWWRIPEVTQKEYDDFVEQRKIAGMEDTKYDCFFPSKSNIVDAESVDRSFPRREYPNNHFQS